MTPSASNSYFLNNNSGTENYVYSHSIQPLIENESAFQSGHYTFFNQESGPIASNNTNNMSLVGNNSLEQSINSSSSSTSSCNSNEIVGCYYSPLTPIVSNNNCGNYQYQSIQDYQQQQQLSLMDSHHHHHHQYQNNNIYIYNQTQEPTSAAAYYNNNNLNTRESLTSINGAGTGATMSFNESNYQKTYQINDTIIYDNHQLGTYSSIDYNNSNLISSNYQQQPPPQYCVSSNFSMNNSGYISQNIEANSSLTDMDSSLSQSEDESDEHDLSHSNIVSNSSNSNKMNYKMDMKFNKILNYQNSNKNYSSSYNHSQSSGARESLSSLLGASSNSNASTSSTITNSNNNSANSASAKRKRKRILNRIQRAEATQREKRRMLKLNKAFEELRTVLPISDFARNKLSRAETLKSAIEHIEYLSGLLAIST